MLSDGNKYIIHILVKGFKEDIKPVIIWLNELNTHIETFIKLIKAEEKTNGIEMVLGTFKGGLYSKHIEVAKLIGELYCKLFDGFWRLGVLEQAWTWFISGDGGLDGIVYLIQNYKDLIEISFELLISVGRGNLIELFTRHFRSLMESPAQYWSFILIFSQLLSTKMIKNKTENELEFEELIRCWIESACLQIEDNTKMSMKTTSISFLGEVWQLFPNAIQNNTEAIIKAFQYCVQSKSISFQIFALSIFFNLFDFFATNKIPYASLIYKTLISISSDKELSSDVREFIIANLKSQFITCLSIPVDPLVKQIKGYNAVSLLYSIVDIELYNVIIKSMKISVKNAIELLDIFAKIMLSDNLFMPQMKTLIMKVLSKFANHNQIHDFVKSFIKVVLSTLLRIMKSNYKNKSIKSKVKENPINSMREKIIIEVLQIIQVILRDDIENEMKTLVLNSYYKLRELYRINYLPLKDLLGLYGNVEEMLANCEEENKQKVVERNSSLVVEKQYKRNLVLNHYHEHSFKKEK